MTSFQLRHRLVFFDLAEVNVGSVVCLDLFQKKISFRFDLVLVDVWKVGQKEIDFVLSLEEFILC